MKKPQTLMILVCTGLLVLGATALTAQDVDEGVQRLLDATDGAAQVRMNPATDVAKFVRFPDGGMKALSGLSAADKADAFLAEYGSIFGIKDAAVELERLGTARSPAMTHVSYQQVYKGVPVFAGVLRATFAGPTERLVALNGVFLSKLDLDTAPVWSADDAAKVAVRHVQGADKALRLTAVNNNLFVFRAGLLQGVKGPNHLVWEVEVANAARTVREFVYVDAHYGKVVDQITGIHEALNRDVSETSLGNVVWTEGDPNPIPGGWSGGSAQQVADWQDEIDGAEETYNFFGSMTNGAYLSYDGSMAQMRTVNNDPNISCPNANWNSVSANYCTGVTADDVVAHEWGHAYTEFTNNLIYQWQSGALNESYSDMWGETVDQLNGRGTDTPANPRSAGGCSIFNSGAPDNSYLWLMGEDATAFGTAIRDMWHPNCENDPGKVSDSGQYVCSTADSGGVHSNSGIPNHAYALMVDGGTYNGFTVSALGFTKAARIHWEAQNLLGPASDFVDHANALDTACSALIGATLYNLDTSSPTGVVSGQTINAGDCAEVADAAAAVELRTLPTFCNFQPLLDPNAPALCGGASTSDIHFQDWESGLGFWTAGTRAVVNPATFDTPDWAVEGSLPDSRPGSAAFVEDGLRGDCAADIEAGVLFLESPVINIPAGVSPQLSFDHWVATELDWDGGNVKVSVNGGGFNVVASSAFDFNAYNGSLITFSPQFGNSDNPMAGESAFTGTDGGSVGGTWGQSQVDLSGIAGGGDDIQIRFEMGLDGCNGVIGWYVDDVRVYSCACGNGVCEAGSGENCLNCAADCAGQTSGKPSGRFCCGFGDGFDPDGCGDSRCTTGGFMCTEGGGVCGDDTCDANEDQCSCPADCGAAPGSETGLCVDDIDNDCDGDVDCDDADCAGDAACQCADIGESCQSDGDCCDDNCSGGKPSTRVCLAP